VERSAAPGEVAAPRGPVEQDAEKRDALRARDEPEAPEQQVVVFEAAQHGAQNPGPGGIAAWLERSPVLPGVLEQKDVRPEQGH
jgi:hypothetical protein